jgi:hypothetical protein
MGRKQLTSFADCDVYKSSNFKRDLRKYEHNIRCDKQIEEMVMFLKRGNFPTVLRYEIEVKEFLYSFNVYEIRWPLKPNIGKSHNTRIWFCYNEELKIVLLLCVYTHNEGVKDIEKSEATKMVKIAYKEYISLGDSDITTSFQSPPQ